MQKYVLAACLLTGNLVFSAGPLDHQTGSLLTLSELREVSSLKICACETVVLLDGKILHGRFNHLPSLQYSFGKIAFEVKDVAMIAFIRQDGMPKMQFITRNGLSYVGNLPKDPFILVSKESQSETQNAPITIAPDTIDYVIFRSDQNNGYAYRDYFYNLMLKNGDQVPVQLASEQIQVSDGWKSRSLFTKDILELNFQNGLQGHVSVNGQRKELGFTLIKDKYLNLELPNQDHIVKIPWNQVAKLQITLAESEEMETPKGFKVYSKNLETSAAAEVISATAIQGLDAIDALTFSEAPKREGSIGFAKSNERKTEPQALFSLLESFDATSEIVFTDDNSVSSEPSTQHAFLKDVFAYVEISKETNRGLNPFDHKNIESLSGALGAHLVSPQTIENLGFSDAIAFSDPIKEEGAIGALDVAGRKTEPRALFSVLESMEFPDEIAFLEEDRGETSKKGAYHMPSHEVITFSDIMNNQNLAKVDVDPEEFDVPPIQEEDPASEEKKATHDEGAVEFLVLHRESAKGNRRHEIAYHKHNTALSEKLYRRQFAVGSTEAESTTSGKSQAANLHSEVPLQNRSLPLEENLNAEIITPPSAGMSQLQGFSISTNLITNEEYLRFIEATGYRYPSHWTNGHMPANEAKRPVLNVSYYDASAYALWCGKRLPTQTEWLLARSADKIALDVNPRIREWTASKNSDGAQVVVNVNPDVVDLLKPEQTDSQTGFRCASDH
jgi:hypothetical protein